MNPVVPFVADALAFIRADRENIEWPERKEIAAKLSRHLATTAAMDEDLELAELLACDSKPEVRKVIAEALVHMPEGAHIRLASRLCEDSNAFVKKAAERAIARRRKSADQSQRLRRNLSAVFSRMETFRQSYGMAATKEMSRIADEQFSTLVQQTHHDIRNILSPALTSISTIQKQLADGRPDKKVCALKLNEMKRSLACLEHFLTDMKEYAKASPTERRRERLADIVHEAHSTVLTALREAKVPVRQKEPDITVPDTLTVFVTRHQVLMALIHVIRNAYESFTMGTVKTEKPHVKVVAKATSDGMVTVTVEDNGPDIHPEDLEELRKFIPGKKSWKANGTGFGLPTTMRYIAAQGGTLMLDSKRGKGTKATITLPVNGEDDDE